MDGRPTQNQATTGLSNDWRSRLGGWFASIPLVPLPFLGLGVYRGWLNVIFEDGLTAGATGYSVSQNAFDLVMIVALLVCASLSRHLTPLYTRRWPVPLCAMLMVGTSLMGYAFASGLLPTLMVAVPYTIMGGLGTALIILLWSELYGMLSPTRICLYYAASLVVGAGVGWLYRGFQPDWLPAATALLPLVSLRCLRNCHRDERVAPVSDAGWAEFSFPWRPVLIIAVYSFAYGLLQSGIAGVSRPNTSVGTVLCALAIAAIIMAAHDRVDFGSIYGALLPFMTAVCLILAAVVPQSPWWANFCANWGYTASQVFIMTMIGSICYHWGASAIWLFGIERAARSLAMMAGRATEESLLATGISLAPLLVVIVMLVTFVAFRERRLSSPWGVRISGEQPEPERSRAIEDRGSLMRACAALAASRNLSQREEEVLSLLAQHKTARDIEHELCVANGTAKAHIRHVYQKLDIHTREELFVMVEAARQQKDDGLSETVERPNSI